MNFTKEYIKECDCPEIQGLKNGLINKGDWWVEEGGMPDTARNECFLRSGILWLPTGNDLDQEIVKICRENGWDYDFKFVGDKCIKDGYKDYETCVMEYRQYDDKNIAYQNDDNPLIAKIQLLKELLNER